MIEEIFTSSTETIVFTGSYHHHHHHRHHPGPTKEVTERKLSLKNLCDVPIAFKMKLTNPKSYCVKPSSDVIAAKSEKELVSTSDLEHLARYIQYLYNLWIEYLQKINQINSKCWR